MFRLDNEDLKEYLRIMSKLKLNVQIIPLHNHCQNLAEKAIQTHKIHFLAGLNSADPLFPLILLDELVSQANITINLLRKSRIDPKISAYAPFLDSPIKTELTQHYQATSALSTRIQNHKDLGPFIDYKLISHQHPCATTNYMKYTCTRILSR